MKLNLSFKETNDKISVHFEEEFTQIPLAFSEKQIIVHTDVEPYEGEYEVNPTFESQTLPTSGKKMLDDLLINEIKVSKVSNPFGGNTICIGG